MLLVLVGFGHLAAAGDPWLLFASGADFYNYAPCAVEGEAHHFWWCQNTDPRVVVDHIIYRRFTFDPPRWHARELALAPGEPGTWDSLHVCDPSVVSVGPEGSAMPPRWALFYLGTDDPTCRHNQVGLAWATAPGGPWKRCPANPIVGGSASTWGVGQPSAINLDRAGRILLFYTRQDEDMSTATYVVEIDVTDPDNPTLGDPRRVPTAGLTSGKPGVAVVLHNADFAYDALRDRVWVVRPRHPFPLVAGRRSIVSSVLQVASIPLAGLFNGDGQWRVAHHVGPEQTGVPLNHNAGFGRDAYGHFPDASKIRLNFATADTGPDSLWTYALRGIVLDLAP